MSLPKLFTEPDSARGTLCEVFMTVGLLWTFEVAFLLGYIILDVASGAAYEIGRFPMLL